MGDYRVVFCEVKDISPPIRDLMADLYLRYYEGTDRQLFHADLQQKREVLLLYAEDTLVGFTTLEFYDFTWQGRDLLVVFSGDTIVEREHWGQQALAFAWIQRMGELKRRHPECPLYWFLIVKGHRTYRYLPAFAKSFYPHWAEDREDLRPLADALARLKFGDDYNPATGVIEFKNSRGHLRADLAFPDEEERAKAPVRFFLRRNPGYLEGQELVCLCELADENLKPLSRRLFAKETAGCPA